MGRGVRIWALVAAVLAGCAAELAEPVMEPAIVVEEPAPVVAPVVRPPPPPPPPEPVVEIEPEPVSGDGGVSAEMAAAVAEIRARDAAAGGARPLSRQEAMILFESGMALTASEVERALAAADFATASIGAESATPELPQLLPWPPPVASARLVLDRAALLAALGPEPTLGEVADLIRGELRRRDYERIGFLGVPGDGFALLTGLEQIGDDGQPLAGDARWIEDIAARRDFSVRGFLDALLFAPRGHYRVMLFVVTNLPFGEDPEREISTDILREWSVRSVDDLPEPVRSDVFGPAHKVTVLVYEFEKTSNDGVAELATPGRWTARQHIAGTDLVRFAGSQ